MERCELKGGGFGGGDGGGCGLDGVAMDGRLRGLFFLLSVS